MKVLIIGSGGREHAIGWKIKQDDPTVELVSAPGNPGLATLGKCRNVGAEDIDSLLELAREIRPDLVVVGPEKPLALRLTDLLKMFSFSVFGPTMTAAQIESSKLFAKMLMKEKKVPTADYQVFFNYRQAYDALTVIDRGTHNFPIVLKANGLAQGKGVYVCQNLEEASDALNKLMVKKVVGNAAEIVLFEDYISGPECSVLAITDGTNFVSFPPIRDFKPVFDGNKGPNTGGMGSIYPIPEDTPEFRREVDEKIIGPVLEALRTEGAPFVGCLYAGLKLTECGPMVVEFNCRFGDPETEVALPMLDENLLDLMLCAVNNGLPMRPAKWYEGACVDIVLASGGYPGDYENGKVITGISEAEKRGAVVFHAGTKLGRSGWLKTAGGRVLNIVACGKDLKSASETGYNAASAVKFDKIHYRRDIGA